MVVSPLVDPSVQRLKEYGDKAYSARDFSLATEHYSEALEVLQDVVVLSNRSATYAQRRRFDKALADAEKALKIEPSWPRLYHRKGHALFHLGKFEQALESFRKGLELDPQDSSLLAAVERLLEHTEEGRNDIGSASADDNSTTNSNNNNNNSNNSNSNNNDNTNASSNPAGCPSKADEFREKGNAFFREGKHSKAVRAYDEAIRADPNDAKSWANRAAAQTAMLLEFGKGMPPEKMRSNPYYTNSMNDISKSLSLDPHYVKAWARKGQLHAMTGEIQEASAAYSKGLAIDPESKECRKGQEALRC
eukprot:TRINITY_DN15780_c0_g2_i1.p1 TRINITY_DN15780_c0_g2~~TRINITY_DN15780_c0_g2_i1.p1  ORF type:complete len:330 (-),score=80.66 TRINITY_DN15780_c0_g2_i1:56-973(-)